ncbi:MAG: hypothetical protein Kow0062_08930 [Acidobacteriota bacterium]
MTIERRPMTDDERARAAAWLEREAPRRLDDWVVGLVAPFALVFVPLLILATVWPQVRALEFPLMLVLLAIGALLALWIRRRRLERSGAALLAADLRGGEVEVARFDVTRGWSVRAAGAEPALLLDVGERRLLYLAGAHVERALADGSFPAARLETVRLPLSRRLLALTAEGDPVPLAEAAPGDPIESTDLPPLDGDVLEPDDDGPGEPT